MMNTLRLSFLSLLLSLGMTVAFAQQYGNNSARNNRGHRGQSIHNYNHGGQQHRAPNRVNRRAAAVGVNTGATCSPRRGNRNFQRVTTTDHYYWGNSRGRVRTTRAVPARHYRLPATCFNGNRRTRYIYSDCGSFYYQIVERRRQIPGRWVYQGCDRFWQPGYTTWVQLSSVPMYW